MLLIKSKSSYKNINNLHSLLKFFYYATIVFAIVNMIVIVATMFIPDIPVTFEKGIRGWFYSVELPTDIGSSFFMIQRSIPNTILHFMPIEMINVKNTILIDSLLSVFALIVLVNIGLKKLLNLTKDILNGESPFQYKHTMMLQKISLIIVFYSTLKNTVLCILLSIFATDALVVTFEFMWSGIIIGVLGYIFSDIAEYGMFLQSEYDTTL